MKKLFLAGLLGFAGSVYAIDFNGVKVDYGENASAKWVGEELVLTFTGDSTLQLDGYAMARILVVGGGGSGSTGYNGTGTSVEYMGNGGAGGEAIEVDRHYLDVGSYEVKVGDGGAAVSPGNSKARTAGKPGERSSFAGIVAEGGAGGVTQTGSQNGTGSNTVRGWGSNLQSKISGSEVSYSVGGAKSTNAKSSGAKGADTGSGGQGGGRNGYRSGAGGKGIVIVRIKAASLYPPATVSYSQYVQYAGGAVVSPFETVPDWAASITGTTNSTERGFFKFTVSLKEGYVWSDTFGREPRTFGWAVVDDVSKGDSYLEVKKTVNPDPSNPSNATISIIGHVPSEKVAVNVLFMGTMCYAHSLRPKTIQSAINSIAQHASVDWYLYHSKGNVNKVGVLRDYDTDVASTIPDTIMHTNLCGTVAKGREIDDNFVRNELDRQMQSNNHQALNSFMELLYEVSQDAVRSKKYDYIVLEFDGSRVANDYTTYAHEAEVAAFLKPYYDAGKVVWLVDNCAAGEFEPFGPSGGSGRKNKYYTPCTYFHNGASTVLETDALYSGLVALTDPARYLSASGKTRAKLATANFSWLPSEGYRKTTTSGEMVKTSKTLYANTRCERQVPYDDPERLSDYLRDAIQEKPYDLRFEDKVVDDGLEITSAHVSTSGVSRATNESGWADISGQPNVTIDIDNAAHTVNAAVLGMCSETWAKLDIAVRDTGTFFADAEPVYNEEADRWEMEKNPNDGNAKVKKYDDGVETAVAEGDSPTLNNWIYPSYLIVGLVTNGTLKIDGVETNAALKAQGTDCEVTYGPDPDYELDYISVDGVRLSPEESAEVLTAYEFTGIVTNHEIVIVYKPGIKPIGIVVEQVEMYYDKNPQNISFTVTNANGEVITPDPEKTKVYYKGPDDADWVPAEEFAGVSNVTKAAGSTSSNGVVTVEVKVLIDGYQEAESSSTVRVMPRVVAEQAGSAEKPYDGLPLANSDHTPDPQAATNYAYEIYHEVKYPEIYDGPPRDDWADAIGFADGDAFDVVPTSGSQTEVGSSPNVVNESAVTLVDGADKENYQFNFPEGTLTVTEATMGIEAFPVEKFYDAEETNVTWIVTNSTGAVITDATISLREKGTDAWIPAADFVKYIDTTNVIVEVHAEKTGYTSVETEAELLVKPRPVTLIAGSAEKTYDGEPLTNWTFTVKEDAAPEYGFVPGEGIESVTMTPESTITEPGTKVNEIASEIAKDGTKLDRNYVISTEPGELKINEATMGIEAFPVEKFYDAEETNVTWIVTNSTGAVITDATISLREKGTDAWISAADFLLYVDTTNVTVQVRAEKTGYTSVETEAELLIKPRPVTLIAGSSEKTYDALPLTNWTFTVKRDASTEAIPGYDFVDGEGVASVTMTPESTITEPGTKVNEIASEIAKEGTKLDRNYVISTEPGELKINEATMGIEAFPVEKFYDAEETNVTWVVTNSMGAVITDATISLREKGTDAWISAADFIQYVDTTNVTVQVKAEKIGYTSVETEAELLIKPRPVTLIAGSAEKTYDGTPLTNWNFTVKRDASTEAIPGYDFVDGEGIESVTMTPESTITEPGTKVNEIASEIAKEGTKLDRNYVISIEPGELKITEATMGIEAFPVEKFYDAEETNITWIVTNTAGAVISDATISLREKGTDPWIPAADFIQYVDTTNVIVQVKAEKTGYTSVETEAELLIKPRPVTLIAGSAEKTYDGEPLTNWNFTVKRDASTEAIPGYDFVADEGVESVTMTPESTITEPGTKVNEIATEVAIEGTKLERNYVVSTEPGELKINEATMGIEAFSVEKFYDAEETNVTWIVTNSTGAVITDATISLREKGTDPWIPAADFIQYVDTTNVIVQVKAEKTGYTSVETEAELLVKPRPVTLIAGSAEKTYDGTPLTNWTFTVKRDASTEAIPGYDFVDGEGIESVTMTPESTITEPGTKANEIASEVAIEGTKLERNYVVSTEPGELKINEATMGIEAFPVEKFYDAEETNITWIVTNSTGAVITDATISLREKGTDPWIPAADFIQYVDTTNVIVQVKAEKTGYTSVETEAELLIKPRPVTLIAASESKYYDGKPLTNWNFTVKVVTSTDGYGFVKNEGVARVEMTPESTITDFGSVPNVIATVVAKPGTDLERNYIVSTEPGELMVVRHCNCGDDPDDPCSPGRKPSRVAYRWKFTGKTTKGHMLAKSVSQCSAPVSMVVRVPTTYALSGVTYICDNCCCTGPYLGDEVSVFTQSKPLASAVASQNLTMVAFNIIGRKGTQIEVAGELEYKPDASATVYHLTFAGFGTWDIKNNRVSSVSGRFAGTATVPYYIAGKCESGFAAGVWDCLGMGVNYGDPSVVFGSWSMRYDAAATKKISR